MDREDGGRDLHRALGEPLATLASLLAQAPLGFQIYSVEGRSLYVNEAFLALFGVAPPPEYNVLQDEIAARSGALALIRRAFRGETVQMPSTWYDPGELRRVRATGGRRVAMSSRFTPLLRDGDGRVTHIGVFFVEAHPELLGDEAPAELQALRRAQEALAASESRYRTIVETAREGVWTFDLQGRTTFANPMLAELLGCTEAELLGRRLDEFLAPEQHDAVGELLAGGRVGRYTRLDAPLRRRDGSSLVAHLSFGPLRDVSDRVEGLLAMVTDVTAQHHLEQEREELLDRERSARETLQLVMDLVPQRLFWKDRAFRYLGCNRVFAQDAGLERPEQIVGKHDFELSWVASAPLYRADDERVIETETPKLDYDEPLVLADGDSRLAHTSKVPLRDRHGRVIGLFGSYEDVTRRRRADEALALLADAGAATAATLDEKQAMQALARVLVPRLVDGCAVLLERGRGLETVAYERAEGAPDDLPEVALDEVLASGEPLLVQAPNEPAGAQLRSLAAVPIRGREAVVGVLVLAAGPAHRRLDDEDQALALELGRRAAVAVENARLYADARRAIRLRDEFLSIASHELKTPLTPLLLKLQSIERALRERGDEKLLEKSAVVMRQVTRLSRLVSELLDVAHLESGRMPLVLEDVDAREVASGAVERLSEQARQAGSSLSLDAPRPVVGRWDALRLDLIVTNLLSNAVKYGDGGPIEIQVAREGSEAVLLVRDRGIGVAPPEVGRIFGRFERAVSGRHYGGLGLGLYITAQSVERLGGTIDVESEVGRGSVFTVRLPLRGPATREDDPPRGEAPAPPPP